TATPDASPDPSADVARVEAALTALATSGATDPSGAPLFPPDLEVKSVTSEEGVVYVVLARPLPAPAGLERAADEEVVVELRRESLLGALSAFDVQSG